MKTIPRHFSQRLHRFLIITVMGMTVTACAVGPDFRTPNAPLTTGYTETALPQETAAAPVTGGEAQHFAAGTDISSQWWHLFHNPALDHLIRQALIDSPTLAASQAALRQAQENLRARSGTEYFPKVDAS